MGAYLNKPVIEKDTEEGKNNRIRFAATSMQGWRINQEDAHNAILEFDGDCSMFAVYDGHGGSEVARYTALHLPDLLKDKESWKAGDYAKAIEEAFLEFDDIIRSEEVLKELKAMAGGGGATGGNGSSGGPQHEPSDDEDKQALYEEAAMPLESILEKYGFALRKDRNGKAVIDLDDLHSLREQHERIVAGDSEAKEENGGEHSNNDAGDGGNKEAAENGRRDDEKAKKRGCESPIAEDAKRSKSSEELVPKEEAAISPAAQRRHCFSESHGSAATVAIAVGGQNSRDRSSKSESEATDLSKEAEGSAAGAPDMRQIADECNSAEKPHPSATPETQTAISSDSEQSLDEDYNEDEEMSEEEESDPDEDEVPYNGPTGDTPGEDSGTTACVLLLFRDKVVVGNAGDSRAVLCRKGMAIDLSVDHKPEDHVEKTRIEAAGGEISMDGRVNGGLNLSRALGDHFYKKNEALPLKDQMISAQPDVTEHKIEPDDEFVVVACDGIWNSMTSQEVVDFVRKRISGGVSLRDICEQMCNECLSPNTAGDGTGCDNMTVIVAEIVAQ